MYTINVPCPLCSHSSFNSVASLRMSLIKAVNTPLTCPICEEIVLGLDKLTLHLIMHSNSFTNNNGMEVSISDDCDQTKSEKTNTTHNYNFGYMNRIDNCTATPTEEQTNVSHSSFHLPQHVILSSQESSCISFPNSSTKIADQLKVEKHSETSKCHACEISFENLDDLQNHKQVMHQKQNQLNVVSFASSTSPGIINNNNKNDSGASASNSSNNDNLIYPCHLCPKSYKMKARLRLHLKVKHLLGLSNGTDKSSPKFNICEKIRMINSRQRDNLDKNSNLEQPTISPNNCKNENTNSIDLIQQNDLLRISEPLLEAKECGFIIQNDSVSSIRLEASKTWKCDVCAKFYTTKYFLKKHKRIHTGETPYTCEICKKSFTFQQSYHKHLLYHSDEKPHICKTCGRAFKELSTLHNHERIHSGEKPFECETCGKRFRQRVSNYVHQRTHTGVKPYTCLICLKNFRYKVTLRTHKCTGGFPNETTAPVDKVTTQSIEDNLKKLLDTSANTPNDLSMLSEKYPDAETTDIKSKHFQKSDHVLATMKPVTKVIGAELSSVVVSDNDETETISTSKMNEEMLSKSIDEIVAESCQQLGIQNAVSTSCDLNEILNIESQTRNISSPTEQLQNLCLYSPMSIDNFNGTINFNEDFFKQLFGEGKRN